MKRRDLAFLSVRELAVRLRTQELSPVELTERYLARIAQFNDTAKAYITVATKQALVEAEAAHREIAQTRYRGPLHGIPYACKDLFQTAGLRTTGGSRVLEDWVPDRDAAAVTSLQRAGSILLGKTNLHEFAHGTTGENPHFGTPPNPWDQTRITGGSSSGSAAAVAYGLAAFGLGTDTGGSIRVPGALCGLVGLKPTYGLVSSYGVIPYCWSLDHVGLLARTVSDAALILAALVGHDPRDRAAGRPRSGAYLERVDGGVAGLRLGLPTTFFFEHVDPEILDAVWRATRILERRGARIVEVDFPDMAQSRTVSLLIQLPEVLSYHSRNLPEKAHLYGPDVLGGLAFGQFVLAEHYVRARRMVQVYRKHMGRVFQTVDAIITPTCPLVAPRIGEIQVSTEGTVEPVGNAVTRHTGFFNLTGHPAMTLPCGFHSTGLPIGVQLIARYFEEATLLRAAHALEVELALETVAPLVG